MIDLRSDTVTRPGPQMRAAMAAAEVGDDVFGDDPSVLALQERVARMFGHEDALFTPTGSMANQIAIQLLVPPGDELLCEVNAHIPGHEVGAAAVIGGISTRTFSDFAAIPAMIRAGGGYVVPTRAIAVEQTHNAGGGTVIPMSTLERLRALADARGVALHCDGARIWHAHVATGIPFSTYGAIFDTMSVCLSKGLGAPVGSLVIGSAERMQRARLLRKRMGGGMRQVGVLAAAGLYALDHHIDRLAEDHVRASRLAKALEPWSRWGGTNIIYLDNVDAPALVAQARDKGVLVGASGPREVRLITHLDVDDAGVDRAADVLLTILGAQ
ncbi:threonine aldolase [Rhizocola hellebori]|uniref:Threonine aldolase n=1 Tax=Rhizocola hellebori TaxID=1392758 RepID=A0A8J3VGB4_9ACTN|nr:GntG family PLP-dependent aldolase [Rhizocola hellebori]GIH04962.1 threonine aldolase [Rhizocola hellebori]